MQKHSGRLLVMACLLILQQSPAAAAVKDQSRITPQGDSKDTLLPREKSVPDGLLDGKGVPPLISPLTPKETPSQTPPQDPSPTPPPVVEPDEGAPAMPYALDDIPALVQIKLDLDIAKRALDAFAQIGSKYDDQGLADYPTLEEFVEKTDAGKKLEAEVKAHGFESVTAWNRAIMNVSFSFSALHENQEQDIRHQIEAVRKDKTLDEKKKQRIIASLNALIQPKENIDIIRQLQKLPEYAKKLNLLNAFE